jgi:Putative zinc-finger
MSDPSCRTFRELLGVYVVGAIEPGERAAVDAHLSHCYECREELAGLAPLPALLHRVPAGEAERILLATPPSQDPAEPSAEMLDSLLERVGARRRSRRFRSLFATAAAILIAVGGAVGVSEALHPQQHPVEVTTATSGPFTATVRYGQDSAGGTQMSVRVHGFGPWTSCKFWVLTKDGSRYLAGSWVVRPGGNMFWYSAHSHVAATKLAAFEIIWQGHRLSIPAT